MNISGLGNMGGLFSMPTANMQINIGFSTGLQGMPDSSCLSGDCRESSGANPLSGMVPQGTQCGNIGNMGMVPGFGGSCNPMGSMFGGMMQQQQMMMQMMMMMMQLLMMMQQGTGSSQNAGTNCAQENPQGTQTGGCGSGGNTAYNASSANSTTPAQSSGKSNANSKSAQYEQAIQSAAAKYNLDPNLIRAVIMTESSFNPNAVSKCGAQGLMQLMPGTAKSLGVQDSFNPSQNIDGGAKYIRQMLDRFGGDLDKALAAYNTGPGTVSKKGITAGGQKYADKVKSYM